jgi:hypothetical protein
VKFTTAPAPRVPRSRRDDRYQAGRPTPYKRPSSGWVKSVQDDTCTVVILGEQITGVIPLHDMPTPGAVVEVETRGDLLCIINWFEHPLPPESMPYAFLSGADPDTEEPAFDATVIPYLSDDSDATFLHFNGSTGVHDYLELYGNPAAIPSTPVTAITMTIRGRCSAPVADPIAIVPYLYAPYPDSVTSGYINYYGLPPNDNGIVLPVGSTFVETTVTFDAAELAAAASPDPSAWVRNDGTVNWTTVDGFVDQLRALGFMVDWRYSGGSGTWDVSSFDMVFETEG